MCRSGGLSLLTFAVCQSRQRRGQPTARASGQGPRLAARAAASPFSPNSRPLPNQATARGACPDSTGSQAPACSCGHRAAHRYRVGWPGGFPGTGRRAPGLALRRLGDARRETAGMDARTPTGPAPQDSPARPSQRGGPGPVPGAADPARKPGRLRRCRAGGSVPGEDRDPVAVRRGHHQLCDAHALVFILGLQLTEVCLRIAAGRSACAVITVALTRKPNRPSRQLPQPPRAAAAPRPGRGGSDERPASPARTPSGAKWRDRDHSP
jgi:hypothetical protein